MTGTLSSAEFPCNYTSLCKSDCITLRYILPNYTVLQYIGNKPPVIGLPKLWSILTKLVCTGVLSLSFCGFTSLHDTCRNPLSSYCLFLLTVHQAAIHNLCFLKHNIGLKRFLQDRQLLVVFTWAECDRKAFWCPCYWRNTFFLSKPHS